MLTLWRFLSFNHKGNKAMKDRGVTDLNMKVAGEEMLSGGDVYFVARKRKCTPENILAHVRKADNNEYKPNLIRPMPNYPTPWRERGVPKRVADQQAAYERWMAMRRMRFVAQESYATIGQRFGVSGERVKTIIANKWYAHAFSKSPIEKYFEEVTDLKLLANMGNYADGVYD
jgi:hypothetical protein